MDGIAKGSGGRRLDPGRTGVFDSAAAEWLFCCGILRFLLRFVRLLRFFVCRIRTGEFLHWTKSRGRISHDLPFISLFLRASEPCPPSPRRDASHTPTLSLAPKSSLRKVFSAVFGFVGRISPPFIDFHRFSSIVAAVPFSLLMDTARHASRFDAPISLFPINQMWMLNRSPLSFHNYILITYFNLK